MNILNFCNRKFHKSRKKKKKKKKVTGAKNGFNNHRLLLIGYKLLMEM